MSIGEEAEAEAIVVVEGREGKYYYICGINNTIFVNFAIFAKTSFGFKTQEKQLFCSVWANAHLRNYHKRFAFMWFSFYLGSSGPKIKRFFCSLFACGLQTPREKESLR